MEQSGAGPTKTDSAVCHFPGCGRPSRQDPAAGAAWYCEQTIDGVVHNRSNAWYHRRAERAAPATASAASSAPVSMARATLEQRLTELPDKIGELRRYFDGVLAELRTASDIEAAGAEVEDAHRDALTKITEAERQAAAAQRACRQAEERANAAELQRVEADAVAEEAIAETARVRQQLEAELERIRAAAAAAVSGAEERATSAESRAAHAEQAAERDRVAAADLRAQLDEARRAAHADLEALRSDHAEQIRQIRQVADERAAALRAALDVATTAAETYRAQLGLPAAQPEASSPPTSSARRRTPGRGDGGRAP